MSDQDEAVERIIGRQPYTPSDLSVKIAFTYVEDGQSEILTRERETAFDRWLAAHDEAVRAEEREKAAQIAERMMRWPYTARDIATVIRAQGKEQDHDG